MRLLLRINKHLSLSLYNFQGHDKCRSQWNAHAFFQSTITAFTGITHCSLTRVCTGSTAERAGKWVITANSLVSSLLFFCVRLSEQTPTRTGTVNRFFCILSAWNLSAIYFQPVNLRLYLHALNTVHTLLTKIDPKLPTTQSIYCLNLAPNTYTHTGSFCHTFSLIICIYFYISRHTHALINNLSPYTHFLM